MTVNKERVQLLVDALRSGEFEQSRNALRRNGGYCCLGVATKVALDKVALDSGLVPDREMAPERRWPWGQMYQVMCPPVAAWYGLDVNPILMDGQGHKSSATIMNDERGLTFHEIANAFERTYLTDETSSG